MYNATNSAPHRPSAYRVDALRTLSLRSTAQLNDLFVNLLSRLGSTRRNSSCLIAPQFNATICLSIYYRTALHRVALRLLAVRRAATYRNATQRFVCYNASPRGSAFHWAPRLPAAHLASTQLNDLFVNLLPYVAPPRSAFQRGFAQLNATICLLLRDATWLIASLRSSTQLNDLFVNLLSRLDTTLGNEPRRNSACRDAQHLNATN